MPRNSPDDQRLVRLSSERYATLQGLAPQAGRGALIAGDIAFDAHMTLLCPGCAPAPVAGLIQCTQRYASLAHAANPAQLPALLFDLTGDLAPLGHYFPTAALSHDPHTTFYAQVGVVAAHPHFDLRLIGERRHDLTADLPASARWLVAGHIVEVLGQRPDILQALLARPRHFRLYPSTAAFEQDGGIAGGDYDAARERVQLGLSRLFEGFGGPLPGVAPFLHEFGHMLDAFDAATGAMGPGRGLLPGLDPSDGALYDAEARRLFAAGKALELQRYEALRTGLVRRPGESDLPLGHPYVFQNNGEFIAGYLELFLRTPHRFATLNPELYAAFSGLLRQDPRPAWPADFAFYVRENQAVYLRGEPIARAGITLPGA